MYQVPKTAIRRWHTSNQVYVPVAIATVCPMCREKVTFSIPTWDQYRTMGLPFQIECPACTDKVTIMRLGEGPKASARVYFDHPQPARSPVEGLHDLPDEVLPERLKGAYQSALNVLAIGEAEATAVTCRRVLEGITARILTNDADRKKTLAQRIKALAGEHEKLAAPLIELSDALRASGNLGAHFDEDGATPSIEDAERMVEMLEYLFTYLYVVPQQIHQFKTEVLGHPDEAGGEGSDS